MTDDKQNIEDVLRKNLTPPSEEDLRLTRDRVLQRLGDAIRVRGHEEREFWGPLGRGRQKPLAEFEQRILAATLRLQGQGEVPSIAAAIQDSSTRSAATAVFFTLSRLEGEGLISSRYVEPADGSAGRAKQYFTVTQEGEYALAAAQKAAAADQTGHALGDFA